MAEITKILELINDIVKRKIQAIPKIEFRKFDGSAKTDIKDDAFYNLSGIYFLTNGANREMDGNGGGTTGALNSISPSFFNNDKFELIFNSSRFEKLDDSIKKIIESPFQIVQSGKPKTNGKYAGSAFFIPSNVEKSGQIIGGVYHIKGINWRIAKAGIHVSQPPPDQDLAIPLIFAYYDEILKNFLSKADPSKTHIIHLAQVPGFLFDGGDETYIGMIMAVENNKAEIDKSNVHIILDMKEDFYNTNKTKALELLKK